MIKNRAHSKLAAALTVGATSLTVTVGEGANFPSTYPFHLSLDGESNREIVSVTDRVTDTLTIVRAQEDTSAAVHAKNAYVALHITAKSVTDLNTAVNTIEGVVVDGEIRLTPKESSSGPEGTMFYASDDKHVYVGAT